MSDQTGIFKRLSVDSSGQSGCGEWTETNLERTLSQLSWKWEWSHIWLWPVMLNESAENVSGIDFTFLKRRNGQGFFLVPFSSSEFNSDIQGITSHIVIWAKHEDIRQHTKADPPES